MTTVIIPLVHMDTESPLSRDFLTPLRDHGSIITIIQSLIFRCHGHLIPQYLSIFQEMHSISNKHSAFSQSLKRTIFDMDVSTFKHFALRKTNSFFYLFQIVMRLGMGIGIME